MMRSTQTIAQVLSWLSLAAVIVPAGLFFYGRLGLPQMKLIMLIATVAWFVLTPLWMGREPADRQGAD